MKPISNLFFSVMLLTISLSPLIEAHGTNATVLNKTYGANATNATILNKAHRTNASVLKKTQGTSATVLNKAHGTNATVLIKTHGTNATILIKAHETNTTILIEKACEHSAHKEFCIASLQADPKCKQVKDLSGLASIALNLVHSSTINIRSNMKALLDIQLDEFAGANLLLQGCQSHWLAATYSIENSIRAMSKHAYGDIYIQVKKAIEQVQHCEELVQEQPRDNMTPNYVLFRKLCSNALAIITGLLAKH